MQTASVSSWNVNPLDLGPLYPFVGSELLLVALCALFWILYTVWQITFEHERYRREVKHLSDAEILGRAIERQLLVD